MSATLRDAEMTFIKALHEATERKLVAWVRHLDDDDREIFHPVADGERVEVELIYFPVATGGVHERVLARVSGLKTYFSVAVGTDAYDVILSMLSMNVFGWQEGRRGALSQLRRATERVSRLVANR